MTIVGTCTGCGQTQLVNDPRGLSRCCKRLLMLDRADDRVAS